MRTTEQRFLDRFKNAGNMLTSGIGGSWRQATETNPNLNRWGNAADTVNGLVGMAGNVIGAAGEVIGVGDAVQGIGAGIDIATAAALDAANSAEADIRFAETVIGAENAKNTVVRSIQGFADANPNTAAGMQAVANAATVGYGAARGVGTATSSGSKAVSAANNLAAKEKVLNSTNVPSERYNRQKHYGGTQTGSEVAKSARTEAEGKPCPTCGKPQISGTNTAPSPQHVPPLVQHYYDHGGHKMTNTERRQHAQTSISGTQCLTCQRKEGAKMSKYSKEQAKKYGL